MAGFIGRAITFTWGGVSITGVREKGVNINGEPVDETSGENNGWRSLLTEAGENTVEISISGVTKSKTLKTDFFAGNRQKAVVITYPTGDAGVISGTFHLVSVNETAPYKDAATYEATLQSTGTVTYTP
jgi:TP901-1 family phage major tail protein